MVSAIEACVELSTATSDQKSRNQKSTLQSRGKHVNENDGENDEISDF